VIFHLLSLNLIVLVKSFAAVFSLQRGKCFPGDRALEGLGWDDVPCNQLLVN
jgi:hypothetical protein